jgi:hypothetical protein
VAIGVNVSCISRWLAIGVSFTAGGEASFLAETACNLIAETLLVNIRKKSSIVEKTLKTKKPIIELIYQFK